MTAARQSAGPDAGTVVMTARGITKSFGATRALRGVDLTLRRGEVHALLGGNGAGKSTLIKILCGELPADAGDLGGKERQIAVVHQELTIMRDLSVAENLFLGAGRAARPFGWRDRIRASREVLDTLGLGAEVEPTTRAGLLPLHQLQLLEIGRALASQAGIVLLDEPTAALTAAETDRLFGVLRRLRDDGTAFVFVSHRMEEIRRLADRMTILRDGVTAVDAAPVDDLDDAEVLRQMFGRALAGAQQRDPRPVGAATRDTVATLHHPRMAGAVQLREGDVLGLAGTPVGPQRLVDALLGARTSSWRVDLADRRGGAPRSTRDAVRRGIGFVSGDRADKGVVADLSIYDNTLLARQVVSGARLATSRQRRHVDRQAQRLGFAHQDLTAPPSSLSGGTQQKFLLARWLDLPVRLLVLEEPTRGVDLDTKRDLYRIVDQLAAAGCAVVWWSTEHAELEQVCDDVLAFDVVGDPVDVLPMSATSEEALLLATGTA